VLLLSKGSYVISKMNNFVVDQHPKTGTDFYDLKTILEEMNASAPLNIGKGLTSFDELGRHTIIDDESFKSCVLTSVETERAIQAVKDQRSAKHSAKVADMTEAQKQGGDFGG